MISSHVLSLGGREVRSPEGALTKNFNSSQLYWHYTNLYRYVSPCAVANIDKRLPLFMGGNCCMRCLKVIKLHIF